MFAKLISKAGLSNKQDNTVHITCSCPTVPEKSLPYVALYWRIIVGACCRMFPDYCLEFQLEIKNILCWKLCKADCKVINSALLV